eukprot:TRINITY_DN65818_c5_g2_i1.p1 TRINITY_DN65818_c5_g2~~TRINITY_DN65818_c5_g2_i1.p1  ORF type:complete len:429 (+),score=249.61 TRINITY_DN65818_c5_g2_i1:180-1466(+)
MADEKKKNSDNALSPRSGVFGDNASVKNRAAAAVVGGLVADAAGIGVHWIYSEKNAVQSRFGDRPEFVKVDSSRFDVEKDFLAHDGKPAGEFTHNGECALLTLRSLVKAEGAFNASQHASDFNKFFGPGGQYVGYVDGAMRGVLLNIASRLSGCGLLPPKPDDLPKDSYLAVQTKVGALAKRYGAGDEAEFRAKVEKVVRATHDDDATAAFAQLTVDRWLAQQKEPVGADDNQMNSLTAVVPAIALFAGRDDFEERLEQVVRFLANNDEAVAYVLTLGRILEEVILHGTDPSVATSKVVDALAEDEAKLKANEYYGEVVDKIRLGIKTADKADVVDATYDFGRSCLLRFGVPSIVHSLYTTSTFEEAVRQHLLAGGDSVSRAGFAGALFAARHGLNSDRGVPLTWIVRTNKRLADVVELTGKLVSLRE